MKELVSKLNEVRPARIAGLFAIVIMNMITLKEIELFSRRVFTIWLCEFLYTRSDIVAV